MGRPELLSHQSIGNSVYRELSQNFYATLQAVRHVLGNHHPFSATCFHAASFPSERMSHRQLWDQFQALSVSERAEILQLLRSRIL